MVVGDARRIERVLRNLIGNAIEHGNQAGIDVSVGADAEAAAVTVRDYGVGLRPGESSLVFNRFWRADPARARTTGGTGLGLAIALEDVRLHRGWLEAWGEPGRGACFRMTLPLVAKADLERSPLPLAPEPAEDPGKTAESAASGGGDTIEPANAEPPDVGAMVATGTGSRRLVVRGLPRGSR